MAWWIPLLASAGAQIKNKGEIEITPSMLASAATGAGYPGVGTAIGAVDDPVGALAGAAGVGDEVAALRDPKGAAIGELMDYGMEAGQGASDDVSEEGAEDVPDEEVDAIAEAAARKSSGQGEQPEQGQDPIWLPPEEEAQEQGQGQGQQPIWLPPEEAQGQMTQPEAGGMPEKYAPGHSAAQPPQEGPMPEAPTLDAPPQQQWQSYEDATRAHGQAQSQAAEQAALDLGERSGQIRTEAAAQQDAARKMQEQEQAAEQYAMEKLEEVSGAEIDPLRIWNDAPLYGKAIAALLFVMGDPQQMGPLIGLVGKYMDHDIQAQREDRKSRVNYWTEQLKDSRMGQQAAEVELANSLKMQAESLDLGARSQEMQANKDLVLTEMEKGLAEKRAEFAETAKERSLKEQQAADAQRIREGQLAVQRGRLALQRQQAARSSAEAANAGPTYSQMLKEMKAKKGIEEMSETGRSPERNAEIRKEAAAVGSKLQDMGGIMNTMDRLYEISGITRGEDGSLQRPDDIKGVGFIDADPLSGALDPSNPQRDIRERQKATIRMAREMLGRAQTGAAISEDELRSFSKMIETPGQLTPESTWFSRLDEFDRAIRAKYESIAQSASPEAFSEYMSRGNDPTQHGVRLGPPVKNKIPTSPRERRREEARRALAAGN